MEHMERQQESIVSALRAATQIHHPDSSNLAPVNERAVAAYSVPGDSAFGLLDRGANGTCVLHANEYCVLVDTFRVQENVKLQQRWESSSRRFVILHEYGHIINGDVVQDHPWSALRRKFDPDASRLSENKASGYAAEMLARECAKAGQYRKARRLRKIIEEQGWIPAQQDR
jgi:hypothetical protein